MSPKAPTSRDRGASTTRRWLFLPCLAIAATSAVIVQTASLARGAAGDLLWSSAAAINEVANDGQSYTALAKSGSSVFAAGWATVDDGTYRSSLRVSAYSGGTGSLVWQQDLQQGDYYENRAQALVARGGRVFMGGSLAYQNGYLAALSGRNGVVLWERFVTPLFSPAESYVLALAVSGTALYALVEDLSQFVAPTCTVRAYDAKTGSPLWSAPIGYGCHWEASIDLQNELDASSLLVKGNRIYVATALWDGESPEGAANALALDKKTGSLLWRRSFVDCGGGAQARMTSLATAGSALLIAGYDTPPEECVPGASGRPKVVVRSIDGASGASRWERFLTDFYWTDTISSYHQPAFPQVVASGKRAIVAGTTYNPDTFGEADWRVKAFDAANGTPLWEQTLDGENDGYEEAVYRVAVAGKTVVAAGMLAEYDDVSMPPPYGNGSRFTVAAWSLADGTPAWAFRRTILESVDASYGSVYADQSVAYALLPVSSKVIVAAGTIQRRVNDTACPCEYDLPGIAVLGLAAK